MKQNKQKVVFLRGLPGSGKTKEWDWFEYLSASDEVKEKHYEEALQKSKDWVTCACGQVCSSLPRDKYGRPEDSELWYLGLEFCHYIGDKLWYKAKSTLEAIEARTTYLLAKTN